jgi:hypothetical protein
VIGKRPNQMLMSEDFRPTDTESNAISTFIAKEVTPDKLLVERNGALVTSLGGCDCWGTRGGCAVSGEDDGHMERLEACCTARP